MVLSRRGFLKAFVAVSSGLLIPRAADVLLLPVHDMVIPDIGPYIRESFGSDIYRDVIVCRLEILAGQNQYGVDFSLGLSGDKSLFEQYTEGKKQATSVLLDGIQQEGVTLNDLRKLPDIPVNTKLVQFIENNKRRLT